MYFFTSFFKAFLIPTKSDNKIDKASLLCEQRAQSKEMPRSWAVIIGVNHYLDPRIPDLKGAVLLRNI